jgi:hypothetical protein
MVLKLDLSVVITFGKENVYFDYILQNYSYIQYLQFYARHSTAHFANRLGGESKKKKKKKKKNSSLLYKFSYNEIEDESARCNIF